MSVLDASTSTRSISAAGTLDPSRGSKAHAARMDRKYRLTRRVYDLTQRWFLCGRNRAIANLALDAGDTVVEIGCGTGRNLARLAQDAPHAQLIGVDISVEMLRSARSRLVRSGFDARVILIRADAGALEATSADMPQRIDRILMSYCLSMIPDWRAALTSAAARLSPGGVLSIVDYGDFRGLPPVLARLCLESLAHHDAPPPVELPEELVAMAATDGQFLVEHRSGPFGYCQLAVIRRTPIAAGAN